MQYVVKTKDGNIYPSIEYRWADIPSNIERMSIYDACDKEFSLEGFDVWFFSDYAEQRVGSRPTHIARMIGGFDSKTGEGTIYKIFTYGGMEELNTNLNKIKNIYNDGAFKYEV